MNSLWMMLVAVAAVALVTVRIVGSVRRMRRAQADDWDAQQVKKLRARGGDPFTPYDIDFFFGVPDADTCSRLAQLLQAEGCTVDFRAVPPDTGSGYSLHARKALRLSVTEMQEHSARYRALARQHGSIYDGWNASRPG
ncbi:MAG: ribonuclease E inhibitor RraB [Gammaproteobacteria bacterium]|nr:ribonuclease E inhibitor RraB [Gammaproteobacteria bacterium]